jgi:hypothetical protein
MPSPVIIKNDSRLRHWLAIDQEKPTAVLAGSLLSTMRFTIFFFIIASL